MKFRRQRSSFQGKFNVPIEYSRDNDGSKVLWQCLTKEGGRVQDMKSGAISVTDGLKRYETTCDHQGSLARKKCCKGNFDPVNI